MNTPVPSPLLRRTFLIGLPLLAVITVVTAHLSAFAKLPGSSGRMAQASASKLTVPAVTDKTTLGTLPSGSFLSSLPADLPVPVPTNTWWSGGIDTAWPAPLFAWPLSVSLSPTGALIDAPGRVARDRAVMFETKDPIRLFTKNAPVRAAVAGSGDWDVTFQMQAKDTKKLFDVTAVQGSPFVFVKSFVTSLSMALPQGSTVTEILCSAPCGSAMEVKGKTRTYLIVSDQKKGLTMNGGQMEATFAATGGKMTVVVLAPNTKSSDYLPYALTAVTGTKASFTMDSEKIKTAFQFPSETLMGVFPHQFANLSREPSKLIGTYETVRGPIRLYKGKSFETSVQKPTVLPGVPPLKADKSFLTQLKKDIAEPVPADGDVYWQGKTLLKNADLIQVADAAGDTALRTEALKKTKNILIDWCTATPKDTAKLFGYDTKAGGIVALPPGFGSEHFNDHHFHYGYFIHAAAIVQQFDATFDKDYGDCIRLLIKDIASFDRKDASFPYLRYFDAYAGHSWAGGLTFFADGNNQESTSEALQAWYSMALYGRMTGNKTLEEQGLWLWSQEAQGAKTYWLNTTRNSGVFPKDYIYPMASIVWGGKYDYATFFDGSDGAVRGIQLFPFTPALFTVLDHITVMSLMTPITIKEPDSIWKTNAIFYKALFYPENSKTSLLHLDPVYSESYLRQWLSISKALGVPVTPLPACHGWIFKSGKGSNAVIHRRKTDPMTCEFVWNGKKVTKKDLKEGWNVWVI